MNFSGTDAETYEITLQPSGISVNAREGQTLLDAIIRGGVQIPYGCRHGNCSACKALVLEGDYSHMDRVSEYSLLGFERDEGYVLLCSTLAESDLTIEVEEKESDIAFYQVHDFEAEITGNVQTTPDIHVIRMKLLNPTAIPYAAGQYFEFDIPGLSETRAYSMAAPYFAQDVIEFHIKRVGQGIGSNYLCSLSAGSRVTGSGPYGNMRLKTREKDLLFVAGGSGMAPIKALIEELFSEPFEHEAWFFYGARGKQDLYLTEKWAELEREHPNFHFIPALSEKRPDEKWTGELGYIADAVKRKMGSMPNTDAYLCGPPKLIETTIEVITRLGIRGSNIAYDEF
ncbi:NADH:ubiquinone reductase (Na(+)-transporting) subunit F [Ferviditalea candida]|uniref:2Fe-2S iron-sulfur cluster-binding protein n=1 Tax=Ferviditalea candida TaxID=3108399 RepID=A0ABU5ZDB7_9BACL|nr:2Fe-2S iron-sulfur cluster-binding protein [Paenibacillaceae bacterium T2]